VPSSILNSVAAGSGVLKRNVLAAAPYGSGRRAGSAAAAAAAAAQGQANHARHILLTFMCSLCYDKVRETTYTLGQT